MSKLIRPALLAALLSASPLAAQSPDLAPRVLTLEKQMRAVQRKVFPGANPTYFDPEIAPAQAPPPDAGTPAGAPLADLTSRVDALEKEVARLTGQVEQNGYAIRQLQEQVTRDKAAIEARLAAPPAPVAAPLPVEEPRRPTRTPRASEAEPEPAAAPAPASTGDAGEDAYLAGYRLWSDKRYPEAQAALKQVVADYPRHKRASYARNLLGRAYLDDDKPAMAAEVLYANYQKLPRGDRAPDSLYYLGVALTRLKKPVEACKVYDELQDVYGATLSASLKAKAAEGRTAAKCK